MGNAFIGKISALVTASTADLERKLRGSKAEIDRFGNSLSSTIGRASKSAEASLAGIFTPLQRLERAIAVSLGAGKRLRIIDEDQAKTLRAAVQVAEQINKPLAGAQRTFTQLSAAVASEFAPALERAQGKVVFLNNRLANTGNVSQQAFDLVQKSIQKTIVSINQLADAQQRLRGLATGNELEFSDPRLAANLAAARRSGQQALTLPAKAIASDPQIEGLVRQISRVSELSVAAAAKVKAALGTPGEAGAKKEAERLDAALARIIARLDRKYQIIVDTDAAETRLNALRAELDQALTGKPQNFDQVAAEYQRLRGEVEKLEVAQRDAFSAGLGQLITLIADGDVKKLEEARNLLQQIGAQLEGLEPAAPDRLSAAADRIRARAEAERKAADDREAELEVAQGRRTDLPAGRQGQARLIKEIGGEIDVVDRKIRDLPGPLQAQLGPAINRIKNDWSSLARDGIALSVTEADRLLAKTREISAALNNRQARGKEFLGAFGGAGEAGLNLGIDEKQLRGVGGQIEFLQTKLSRYSAEARGPAVAALQRYREVNAKVFAEGAQNTEKGRAAIDRAAASVVRLTARLQGVKTEKLAAQLQRVGDVARGVGSKGGLAFQQLVFAVDDFFSVTGGLDQRLRAAGNNISQFGFIIGGTTGLILGVAASLAGQGLAALLKWSGGTVQAEDKAKALNDALKRQSELVNELQQAFSNLGPTLLEGVFSSAALAAQKLADQIERIIALQKDLREDRAATFDPEVQRERALQSQLERSKGEKGFLGREKSLEELVAIEQRIALSRERERVAAARAVERARGLEGQTPRIASALELPETLRLLQARPGAAPTAELREEARGIAQRRAEQIAALAPAEREAAIRELRQEVDGYLASVRREFNLTQSSIDDIAGNFDAVLEQFRLAASEAADPLVEAFASEAARLRDGLSRAGTTLEESIKEGIPGAARLRSRLDELGEAIRRGNKAIEDSAGLPPDQQKAVRENAIAGVREARRELEARQKEVAAIDSARRSIDAFAAALDRVADQLVNTLAQEARAAADQARRDANRERGILEGNLGGRQEDVDRAQRRRVALEEEALAAELRAARQRAASLRARNQFEEDAVAGRLGKETQQLVAQRDAAQAVLDDPAALGRAKREAEAVLGVVNVQLQQIFERSGAAEAARRFADALDAAAASVAGQQAAIDRGRELLEAPGAKAGRELRQDIEALRAAASEKTGIDQIRLEEIKPFVVGLQKAFEEAVKEREAVLGRPLKGDEPVGFDFRGIRRLKTPDEMDADRNRLLPIAEAFDRLVNERLRQAAPAIFGLADAVANAVAQGPSRAALQATDVSTVEGARELNRLLRGEDGARDQNLVELQRQSQLLEELVQAANNPQVAN